MRRALDIPALSPGWKGSFDELLSATEGAELPGWAGFRRLVVTQVVPESTTVTSLYLEADGAGPPGSTGWAVPDRAGSGCRRSRARA